MITTTLEKYLIVAVVALLASGGAVGWWIHHNHAEQKIGAQACIQSTTVDKTEAHADVVSTQAAQAVDIKAVVQGYETKVKSLSRDNDALALRLSASGAVCPSGVSDTRRTAGGHGADPGLAKSQDGPGTGSDLKAKYSALLAAGDANQVRTEDCATLYNQVRDRAIAAAAKLNNPQ